MTEREIKNSVGKAGVEFLVTRPLSARPTRPRPHSAGSKPTGNLFAGYADSGFLTKNLVDCTHNFLSVSALSDRVLVRQSEQPCLHSANTTLILFIIDLPPFQVILTLIRNLDMDTVNALLEKRLKILSNVFKESTSSPLWTYMWSLQVDMKKMKFIKFP